MIVLSTVPVLVAHIALALELFCRTLLGTIAIVLPFLVIVGGLPLFYNIGLGFHDGLACRCTVVFLYSQPHYQVFKSHFLAYALGNS